MNNEGNDFWLDDPEWAALHERMNSGKSKPKFKRSPEAQKSAVTRVTNTVESAMRSTPPTKKIEVSLHINMPNFKEVLLPKVLTVVRRVQAVIIPQLKHKTIMVS